ncbi:uncharacterized protein HKW66_Vig0011490 [Vigna angularis]|uniref:Uncharacterized protein n=1 Tax=Phaseolus angularis TaxID=3914 RepID=A0A8T0LET0_PHAAN|nr:uncharacterized protein HKW66_Vig0011490 [Vigna angularis]
MLISLEALAMAGASSIQVDVAEWELRDSEQNPPPHLLAEHYCNEEHFLTFTDHQEKLDTYAEKRKRKCIRSIKAKLRALVTACMFMLSDACNRGSRKA